MPSLITLFTFGYEGWGNATPQLVQAVDVVERSRGFKPPIFVDVRIRRSVRAEGFKGSNFEKLLGPKRHRWMKSLGNEYIIKRKGPRIQIAEPEAVEDLLDLAEAVAAENRRLIFFCNCPWVKWCHRRKVADLTLDAARKRKTSVRIAEWPGGEPTEIELKVGSKAFAAVNRGNWSVPLGANPDLATYCGLPWYSLATIRSGSEVVRAHCEPAKFMRGEWALPIQCWYYDPDTTGAEIRRKAKKERALLDLNERAST